jgi:hypothetical protein
MNFVPMEIKEMKGDDLAALLEAMRALALTKNRVALDLLVIVEREMLSRHESTPIADYADEDLSTATACLCCAVDTIRASGVEDDYPASRFLLLNLTALLDELEKRGLVHEVQ